MLIARLVFKDIVELNVRTLRGGDLLSFMGSHKSHNVKELRLLFRGLIVQEPSGRLHVIKPGSIIRLVDGEGYCKWHSGPLNVRDNPVEREYCVNPTRSSLGYCFKHLKSDRALYDKCVSGMGVEAFEACRVIDRKYRGLEHVVYLVVLPTGKIKVGVTRKFRIYERIAEQQHVLAVPLIFTDSILKARRIELELSRVGRISDKGLRSLIAKPYISLEQAYNILETIIESLKRNNKFSGDIVENTSREVFRIQPPKDLIRAKELESIRQALEKQYTLRDYWGGYLLLEDEAGRVYAIKTTRILHRKSIIVM